MHIVCVYFFYADSCFYVFLPYHDEKRRNLHQPEHPIEKCSFFSISLRAFTQYKTTRAKGTGYPTTMKKGGISTNLDTRLKSVLLFSLFVRAPSPSIKRRAPKAPFFYKRGSL